MEKDLNRLNVGKNINKEIRMKDIKENIQFIQFFVTIILEEFEQRKIAFTFSKPLGYGLSPQQMTDEIKQACRENNIDIEDMRNLVLDNLKKGKKR